MDRRDFLKTAGVGSAAVAAFPVLAEPAFAHRRNRSVVWLSISKAATTPDGVAHTMVMSGRVHFHGPDRSLRGGGYFQHFDNAPTAPTPKPVLAAGRWRATDLANVDVIGAWGVFAAGVVEMTLELRPLTGTAVTPGSRIRGVTIRVVCNLGFANLFNPPPQNAEGFYLTIPGGAMGTFQPFGPSGGYPGLGLTVMTRV
jgi:hypothetical protein